MSLTLTPKHHKKVEENMRRLGLTRADLIGLLIDKFAEVVALPGKDQKYERLRDALSVLGGRLERRGFSGPRGALWVVELGGKHLSLESDGETFPLLDDCFEHQDGVTEDRRPISPAGVARLLSRVAAS